MFMVCHKEEAELLPPQLLPRCPVYDTILIWFLILFPVLSWPPWRVPPGKSWLGWPPWQVPPDLSWLGWPPWLVPPGLCTGFSLKILNSYAKDTSGYITGTSYNISDWVERKSRDEKNTSSQKMWLACSYRRRSSGVATSVGRRLVHFS